jgi:hypothetical protein
MHNHTQKEKSISQALLGLAGLLFLESVVFSLSVVAQPKPSVTKTSPTPYSRKFKPLTPIQAPTNQKSILESLLSLLQRKRFLGGSRNGGGFCGITPSVLGNSNVVWSDRPLFLWQGKVQSLELRPYKYDVTYEKQPILWNFSPTAQQVRYPNPPLQAGQRYEWQVMYVSPQTNATSQWQYVFQIMEQSERDRMGQDLNSLDTQLKRQNMTGEEVALARANFFASKDLWSDAIEQIDAVGHSFGAGDEFIKAATKHTCDSKPISFVDATQILQVGFDSKYLLLKQRYDMAQNPIGVKY